MRAKMVLDEGRKVDPTRLFLSSNECLFVCADFHLSLDSIGMVSALLGHGKRCLTIYAACIVPYYWSSGEVTKYPGV